MADVRARLTAYRKSKGKDCTTTDVKPLHPSILWAQRSDTILLTVSLNDICDETFSLEENAFEFSGVGGAEGRMYKARIEFFKDVLPQKFKHKKTDRGLFFEIKKKEKGPYWPRLLSEPTNVNPYQISLLKDNGRHFAARMERMHTNAREFRGRPRTRVAARPPAQYNC